MPKIGIEKYGNRIRIKPLEYLGDAMFPKYLATVRQVPGSSYSKANRCQTAPLDIEVCRVLRELFGKSLVIGPELTAWARDEVAKEKEMVDMLGLDMAKPLPMPEVERLAPTMYAAMMRRGYQSIAPAFAKLAGNYINADQPGLGKTVETFASLIESGIRGHVLVIGPSTAVTTTWPSEVEKWMAEVGAVAYVATGDGMGPVARQAVIEDAVRDQSPFVFVMVNAEMVRLKEVHDCPEPDCNDREFCRNPKKHKVTRESKYPLLFDVEWASIIGDETHRYLINANPRARQKSQVGMGFQRLRIADPSRGKVALSGTPMKGRPRLLWPTLHWLRPDLYTGQWRWSKHYFKTEADAYAQTGEKVTDDLRPEREEAFNRELSRIMLRRTKDELRAINPEWAPPEKAYAEVWLPMTRAQARLYKAMERDAAAMMEGGRLSANGILAEMTRLRQFASCAGRMENGSFVPALPSNKFDWIVDVFLAERGITGDPKTEQGESKVVIASQFTSMINLWANALREKGITCRLITGETKQRDRVAYQDEWQNDPSGPRVMFINTMAGGVSITLDYADDLAIMDETWVPDDQEQVEDRVHRTSRTDHQVTIWYVRSEGSIERDLAGTNVIKDERQKRSLDGRRGIEVARQKWGVKDE